MSKFYTAYYATLANDRIHLRSSARSHYVTASPSANYGGTVTFHRDDRGPFRVRRITRERYREWHDWAVRRYAESARGTAGIGMTPADNWVAATPEVLALLAQEVA
jgi:hypothetical protein